MNSKIFVLLKLLLNGKYTISEIASEFGTSERLIRYIIDDCDFYLHSLNLPSISFGENGVFLKLNEKQRISLLNTINNIDVYSYNLSAQERQDYILLCLLCCTEPLKISFFTQLLNVSKSSIDKDIALIKQSVEKDGIDICSESGKGLFVSGKEVDIRTTLIKLVSKYFDFAKLITEQSPDMYSFLEKNIYICLFEMYYKVVLIIVNEIESKTKRKLSFLSYKELCVYLVIMINRINFNKSIYIHGDYIEQVKNFRSFTTSKAICERLESKFKIHISNEEISYLSMILESAHYTTLEDVDTKEWAFIQILANKLIDDVSKELQNDLTQDKELLNALTLHLGITIKRLYYNVPIINSEVNKIIKNYTPVFEAIKSSVHNNDNNDWLMEIDNDDIAYLTLHFQAAIERKKEKKSFLNIIVVCIHGYGTASLMKEMIISNYPNINVKKIMTRDSVDNNDLEDIDFIVSSVNLQKQKCPVVKVNSILKKQDYLAIDKTIQSLSKRKQVNNGDTFEEILNIISKETAKPDDELRGQLLSYLNNLGLTTLSEKSFRLCHYLRPENIRIIESCENWKEAIKDVGLLLVKSGAVSNNYINSIISTVETAGSYMVIDDGIALVHGDIDKHVLNTAMSLLIVKNGVNFNSNHYNPVHFILCLAAKDTHSHNKALSDFLEIITDYKNNKEKYFDINYIVEKIQEVSEK